MNVTLLKLFPIFNREREILQNKEVSWVTICKQKLLRKVWFVHCSRGSVYVYIFRSFSLIVSHPVFQWNLSKIADCTDLRKIPTQIDYIVIEQGIFISVMEVRYLRKNVANVGSLLLHCYF